MFRLLTKMVPNNVCYIVFVLSCIEVAVVLHSLEVKSHSVSVNGIDLSANFLSDQSRYRVVFVRHGESEWNKKNLYTGWYDAKLTFKGVEACKLAGKMVKKLGLRFDKAYTSLLSRAQTTLNTILEESQQKGSVAVHQSHHLNERHYGALTGLDKNVTFFKRTFDERPEPMLKTHRYWHSISDNPLYSDLVASGTLPQGESLQDTLNRVLPYWNTTILPEILAGERVIIAAHKNTLCSLFKYLENLDKQEATDLFIEYSVPIIYEFDEHFNIVIARHNLY